MEYTVPLEKMTKEEKIKALQDIWQDLSKSPEEYNTPAWHADVLREREELFEKGEVKSYEFDEAKRIIAKLVK